MRPANSILLLALASPALGQQNFLAVEPNQDKSTATRAIQMGSYDRLVVSGLFTFHTPPNVFRIEAEALPLDLYRYELRFDWVSPSTVLGRTAVVDQVDPQSTTALQTMVNLGSPSPYLSWYGFGKSEEVFVDFHVAGGGRMFGASAELLASPVFERDLGSVPAGANVLRARAAPGTPANHDLELLVFDAELNALPYGSNDESALSLEGPALRFDVPPGLYHVAVCDHPAATHLPPDANDLRSAADVLDFRGALMCGSAETDVAIELLVEDGGGVVLAQVGATKVLPYETLWFRVQVGVGQALTSFCPGDGSRGPCSCLGAAPPNSRMGCRNSTGRGATVIATDHITGGTGAWRVTLEDLPPQTLAIAFVGLQATAPAQLFGGSSCIAPGAVRTPALQADQAGTAVITALQPIALGFLAGQRLYVQGAYRDALAPVGCQINFTSGYSFVVR